VAGQRAGRPVRHRPGWGGLRHPKAVAAGRGLPDVQGAAGVSKVGHHQGALLPFVWDSKGEGAEAFVRLSRRAGQDAGDAMPVLAVSGGVLGCPHHRKGFLVVAAQGIGDQCQVRSRFGFSL
jgi:hypothetical protein